METSTGTILEQSQMHTEKNSDENEIGFSIDSILNNVIEGHFGSTNSENLEHPLTAVQTAVETAEEKKKAGSFMEEILFSYAQENLTHTRDLLNTVLSTTSYENEALNFFLIRLPNHYKCPFCSKQFQNSDVQAGVAHTKAHHWQKIVAKEIEEREKMCHYNV